MSEKAIYIGNGKKQKDNWFKSSICLTDIPQEHVFEFNGKKYVKVNVNVKDAPDQYGKDVSITVDTWKPDNEPMKDIPSTGNDLPF